MRKTIISCDNCDEVTENDRNVTVRDRRFDVCDTCLGSKARNLNGTPVRLWPRLVRSADVRAWLESEDREMSTLTGEVNRLRAQLEKPVNEGRTRDLALDLLNLTTKDGTGLREQVEVLQARARELV